MPILKKLRARGCLPGGQTQNCMEASTLLRIWRCMGRASCAARHACTFPAGPACLESCFVFVWQRDSGWPGTKRNQFEFLGCKFVLSHLWLIQMFANMWYKYIQVQRVYCADCVFLGEVFAQPVSTLVFLNFHTKLSALIIFWCCFRPNTNFRAFEVAWPAFSGMRPNGRKLWSLLAQRSCT